MKKIFFSLSLCIAIIVLFDISATAQNNSSSSFLRHVVIISFKDDAAADTIKALDKIYTDLSKSPLVKDFEMGVNVSARDSGIVKHIYVTSFASKEDLDSYRKIPEYGKLFKISLPISNDVTVVDYWTKK